MAKDGEEEDEGGGSGWTIIVGTGGRPIRCQLPPDLSDRQCAWISERLPPKAKLQRNTERVEAPSLRHDDEQRLDALRTLTQQVCEKKIELIELERATSELKIELQQINYQIEERRKHARSFAGTFGDLWAAFEKKK